MLPENLLWAYIVQLSSVIRTIHTAGLSVRSLDPTKVLLVSITRPNIRLNCCGIYDIVTFDPSNNPVTMNQFCQVTLATSVCIRSYVLYLFIGFNYDRVSEHRLHLSPSVLNHAGSTLF